LLTAHLRTAHLKMVMLNKAGWLQEKNLTTLFEVLGTDNLRVVGGCVRDTLIGKPVTDIDMATTLVPERVQEKLTKAGFKVVPIGINHGTVAVVTADRQYEITTLRRDIETDGRHAVVQFGTDWLADAERRDFTVNALYADAAGQVYDPLAAVGMSGLADLEARRGRFIGDPGQRIAEDYLRVFRFFRFHHRLADNGEHSSMDTAGLAACQAAAKHPNGLGNLSGERLRDELFRLLAMPQAVKALQEMAGVGVLAFLVPLDASAMPDYRRLTRLIDIEDNQLFCCDPLLRLGALLPEISEAENQASYMAQHLRLSKKQTSRLSGMSSLPPDMVCYMSAREMRRMLYLLGQAVFRDCCQLAWAADRKESNAVQWRALLAMAESWQQPDFPLTGEMMKSAGVPEGPEMSRVYGEVEKWWIDSDFTEDIFSVIERLKAVVQATLR